VTAEVAVLLLQSKATLLAPELAVEAVEGELSRHGRLPARTQFGELAGKLALGQPDSIAQASEPQIQPPVMRKTPPSLLIVGRPNVLYSTRSALRQSAS
jgi:hypothetical protein